jgi:LmbE family N-acetylglucosaminyl deacetylase
MMPYRFSIRFAFSALCALAIGLCTGAAALQAQPVYPYGHPVQRGSGELLESIRGLQVLGGTLYVAAHPDDENTRMIAWLAGERQVSTTYLSLTRGDGGQNLIGPEMRALLGVLRTQELLMARGVDRGEQMFTRANDFGYSRHPDETLALWDRDEVLADVVWAIRRTRPDIIINRFDHRSPGRTHGHHTASAMLALEAFRLAADPAAFPWQLQWVEPWQASRIFFNTSWWFYGSQEAFEAADKSGLLAVDVGAYNAARGLSYTEIAARSRSMHRCQGFGSTGSRGSEPDYLEWLDGQPMPEGSTGGQLADPLAGLDLSWNRVEGGGAVEAALRRAEQAFDPDRPERAVDHLMEAWMLMADLEQDSRVRHRREQTADLIRQCLGLWAEVSADRPLLCPGDSVLLRMEFSPRCEKNLSLRSAQLRDARGNLLGSAANLPAALPAYGSLRPQLKVRVPADASWSTAYWLLEPESTGMFAVTDTALRGLPQSPAAWHVEAELSWDQLVLPLRMPVVFKENDPVRGEVYQPVDIVPPAVLRIRQPSWLFNGSQARRISLSVLANRDSVRGVLRPVYPEGWSGPESLPFQLDRRGDERSLDWEITPPAFPNSALVSLVLEVEGHAYPLAMQEVAYDHIPAQTILQPAALRLTRTDAEVRRLQIAYVMGAGDDVPRALQELGCTVTLLEDADLVPEGLDERLARFDAIVAGVRAYNTRESLARAQEALMRYVASGGLYLVQYNTNRGLVEPQPGPYQLGLSRERVTEEGAAVQLLDASHPALSTPNRIGPADFEDWVQERGLYFPDTWDPAYTALLSMADTDQKASQGSLLVAPYGKGWYVYTGLSFFRQLPEGVPGAFRLMANLLSLGR